MDPVSQGVVGAVSAGSLPAKPEALRLAVLAGWLGGVAADADVLIRSKADPLLVIEYHRHFSHSLVFIPIGGAIVAGALWALLGGKESFAKLFGFAAAGYATAGLLDACTSYGTQLLWPFSESRVAWNIISIVDPIFTVSLLVLLLLGIIRKQRHWVRGALALGMVYLGLGVFQKHRATRAQEFLAEGRGHAETMKMATVKPSIGNLVLWRSLYRYEDQFFVDAIRVGLRSEGAIYEGDTIPVVEIESLLESLPRESRLAGDLQRFDRLSSSYLAAHPHEPNVLGDCRYALLPNSITPLWGIRFDPADAERHVSFESFREVEPADRQQLIGMLFGREAEADTLPPDSSKAPSEEGERGPP